MLGGIAVEVAKEALEWAVAKVKERAKDKLGKVVAESIDPKVIEGLLTAELHLLAKATEGIGDAFEPPSKPLGLDEPLLEGMDVEVIKP